MLISAGVGDHLQPQLLPGRAPSHPKVAGGGPQWWETFEIYIFFIQDGLSLLSWSWPIGHPLWCCLYLSHQWGQWIAHFCPGIIWVFPCPASPPVRVLSLWGMPPDISTLWSWVTRFIFDWWPLSMKSPRMSFGVWRNQYPPFPLGGSSSGNCLVWPQFPHSVESPGNLLTIPRI